MAEADPALVPGVADGFREIYRRTGCDGESYEALIKVNSTSPSYYPVLQGTSGDGKQAIVLALDKLTPDAASERWQAYYASDGELHLLCVRPNGSTSAGNCSGGTSTASAGGGTPQPGGPGLERYSTLDHAISDDGSKVYWTESGTEESGPGQIFVRENPDQPESADKDGKGNCIPEAERACTIEVSGSKTTQPSRFLGASPGGESALFQVTKGALAGKLYKFVLGSGSTEIAGRVLGVAGASEDLSRVYFVSEEAIAGSENGSGGEPIADKANLYLDDGGTKTFIATISEADAVAGLWANAKLEPIFHAARTTPDGRVLTFISTERLTGYDNTDLTDGEPDSEVYLYEVGAPGPVCVSCNPSGARPLGRMVTVEGLVGVHGGLATAGSLAMPDTALYSPHILTDNGHRLFFNSFDALLPRDSNGKQDIYEWESASSQAACEEQGAELYVAAAAGCLSLISSGESPQDSELLDASGNGEDVFFTTNASLLPRDPGLIDVYDARVGGGFAEPPPPPAACRGEACQPTVSGPNDPTPSSSSYAGPGNEGSKKKPHHKKKQKRKSHHKLHKHHHKKQNQKKGGRR